MHALGHYLGAAHSPETDSVMRPMGNQPSTEALRFDPINALAMALVGEEFATAAPQGLAGLSPRARQRLVSIYATLAEGTPDDPLADRFLRLLSVRPIEPSSRPQPFVPEPPDAGERPTQPSATAPRDGESPASTAQPAPSDPAQSADRAVSLSASAERHDLDDERADPGSDREPDRSAVPLALALALVLVAILVAMLAWRLTHRDGAPRRTDGEEIAPPVWQPMQSVDRAVWSAYLASVAGVAMLSATSLFSDQVGGLKAAAVLLAACLGAMVVAPLYPMVGPLAYFVLSHAVQGDDPAHARIEDSGTLACLPVITLAALGLRFFRQRRRPQPTRGITTWVLLVMMAWIGLTAAGAVVS